MLTINGIDIRFNFNLMAMLKSIFFKLGISLFLMLFAFPISSFAQTESDIIICKDLSHIINQEKENHQKLLNFTRNPLTQNYDLKYHRMEWEVDPAVFYIKGKITSYFIPTQDNFQQINFDLGDNMQINEILYHGTSLSSVFTATDNLQIELPNVVNEGVLDSISISYEGAPASNGFGSFQQTTHEGVPIIWTLSEPYGAKTWWPCKQDLNDKIDSIDIIVRTPSIYKVGTNGVLKNTKTIDDDHVYHWKHRYPIPAYLIAIAITNYAEFSHFVPVENEDPITVLNYVFPENLGSAEAQLAATIEQMELYNELFGVYPFADEKYGHAQFGWGGGMEHQTMSFMANFSYGLQAHELAHQWFGDKVTCGSWEDIWLNEGFATYLTGLTSEFLGSSDAWYNWKSGRIGSITSAPDGSVWVDDTTNIGRIFNGRLSYSKGSYLLHMLRYKLGDDDFFQGVRNYLEDPEIAFSYAKTADLQQHLETVSGFDLEEYFKDWFYRQGHPSYHITWNDDGDKFLLKADQLSSHASVSFFEMPIPILVSGEGQDSMVRLEHEFSGQVFEIDLPFKVESVEFDPDLWILSAGNTVEEGQFSSTADLEELHGVSIFPNPVLSELTIEIDDLGSIKSIEFYNSNGQLIQEITPLEHKFQVKTVDWKVGVYLAKIYMGSNYYSLVIVKQ